MEGWRDEARRCKRGERNEGWSVGRISCLVSFTVARCVMTVEWIIISLSFRLLRLPPSRLSPLSLYTPSLLRALSSCTSCKKARLLHALSTFSPPPCKDMQSGMGKGWVVGWPWSSRRALEGGLERRYTRMGKGGGELEGRSRQNVPRNVPFSVPLFLLPTVVTNTLEFSCAAGGWYGGKEREEKGKKERKGRRKADANPVKRG